MHETSILEEEVVAKGEVVDWEEKSMASRMEDHETRTEG